MKTNQASTDRSFTILRGSPFWLRAKELCKRSPRLLAPVWLVPIWPNPWHWLRVEKFKSLEFCTMRAVRSHTT